jgi:hypothetical protein
MSTLRISKRDLQNLETNYGSRSNMNHQKIHGTYKRSMKSLAISSPLMVFLQGKKCTIFVSQSTITNIASKFFEDGKSVMKSMKTENQGCLGIGSGYRSLYGRC